MKHALALSRSAAGRWFAAYPYAVLATLFLLAYAGPFCLREHSEWDDVYLRGAQHLQAGAGVYGRGENYVYPPFMAWAAIPFTALPHLASRMVWYLINVIGLFLLVRWCWRLSGGEALPTTRQAHAIFLLGLAGSFYYSLDCLTNQKCDLIIGAVMVGGCLALSRCRSLLAATLFGIAAAMKCTPLLWSPYLAWRGHYRAAVWMLCVAAGVNLLPDLTHPRPDGLWVREWFTRYVQPMGDTNYRPGEWASDIQNNQSLSGAAHRCFLANHGWAEDGRFCVWDRADAIRPATLKRVLLSGDLVLVLAGWLVLWTGARRTAAGSLPRVWREPLEFSIVLLLMLLLSPMSSKTHYCVLLLPALCVARLVVERCDGVLGVVLLAAIGAGVLSNKDLWGRTIYIEGLWYGSVTCSAMALLLGCGYALVRANDRRASGEGSTQIVAFRVSIEAVELERANRSLTGSCL